MLVSHGRLAHRFMIFATCRLLEFECVYKTGTFDLELRLGRPSLCLVAWWFLCVWLKLVLWPRAQSIS